MCFVCSGDDAEARPRVQDLSWSRSERPWEQGFSKTSLALDVDLQSRGLGSSHALTTSWSLVDYWS